MYLVFVTNFSQLSQPNMENPEQLLLVFISIAHPAQPSQLASSLSRTCKRQALGSTACNWNEEKRTMKINAWTMATCAHTEKKLSVESASGQSCLLSLFPILFTSRDRITIDNPESICQMLIIQNIETESTKNTLVQNTSLACFFYHDFYQGLTLYQLRL